jgi:hypothetical protein
MKAFWRTGGTAAVMSRPRTQPDQDAALPRGGTGDRREHRRHDVEQQGIAIERWDGRRGSDVIGRIVDISAGGVRFRTTRRGLRSDHQVRVRLELPSYAGISPFIDTARGQPEPKQEWVGWMAVCRVTDAGEGEFEVAARLLDMEDMDRGMLGLYLSTQPLAA